MASRPANMIVNLQRYRNQKLLPFLTVQLSNKFLKFPKPMQSAIIDCLLCIFCFIQRGVNRIESRIRNNLTRD